MSYYAEREDLSDHVFQGSSRGGHELARLDSYDSPFYTTKSSFNSEGTSEMGGTLTTVTASSTDGKPIVETRQVDENTTVTNIIFPSSGSGASSFESTTVVTSPNSSPTSYFSSSPYSPKSRDSYALERKRPKSRSPKKSKSPHVSKRQYGGGGGGGGAGEVETIELTTTIQLPSSPTYSQTTSSFPSSSSSSYSSPYSRTSSSHYSPTRGGDSFPITTYESPSATSSSYSSYSSSSHSSHSSHAPTSPSYISSRAPTSPTYVTPSYIRSPTHHTESFVTPDDEVVEVTTTITLSPTTSPSRRRK